MMTNHNLKEFWRGYRHAKIYAYLWAVEHVDELASSIETDGESENFANGFLAGVDALKVELASLLDKDREAKE